MKVGHFEVVGVEFLKEGVGLGSGRLYEVKLRSYVPPRVHQELVDPREMLARQEGLREKIYRLESELAKARETQ